MRPVRLAVLTSHPIQYYAPLFRALAQVVDLHVLFAHRATPAEQARAGFGTPFEWDVDLTSGYAHSFLKNVARQPGTDRFPGLRYARHRAASARRPLPGSAGPGLAPQGLSAGHPCRQAPRHPRHGARRQPARDAAVAPQEGAQVAGLPPAPALLRCCPIRRPALARLLRALRLSARIGSSSRRTVSIPNGSPPTRRRRSASACAINAPSRRRPSSCSSPES